MNDHNLDDLIIDTDTPKPSKAKGFLTIIALFIVVLIVAIILTKIILKDPDAQQATLIDENTEMVSPELTLQGASEEEKKPGNELSDMIADEMNTPEEEQHQKNEQTAVSEKTVVIDESKPASSVQTKQSTQTAPVTKREEKVAIPSSIEPETPKKTVTKKPPVTKVVKKTAPVQASSTTYYVQVASYSKTPTPDSRLLRVIRKNGYRYTIFPSHGMKKVLIGPYRSRAEADRAIVRIKDRITKDAFVFTK